MVKMSKMWKSSEHSKVAELYDLKNTLGRGHFAVVKLAEHVFSGEKVAVKVIDKTKMDQISADHLYHEVTCMKLVQHPNVVRLYQVIETQSKLYLILELGDGGDMFDYIMKHGEGLQEDVAKEYFAQIVSAIAYCHKLHVVHRDLKPENVVFFKSQGLVKLTDFGFSNRYRPGEKLSTSCGSLAYSAPEILLGEEYDAPAVDVWSLGVILYMLVCGIAPFNEANDSETLINIMDCRYQVHDHVSSNCQDLIQRMLIREPSERIGLSDLVDHPWLIGAKSLGRARRNSTPILVRNSISKELHKSIVDVMMKADLADAEEIKRALDEDRYDHITSTYFLLAERSLMQQENTCSSSKGSGSDEDGTDLSSSSAGKTIPNKLRPMHPDNNSASSPMLYSVSPPCKQATLLPPSHVPAFSSDTTRRRTTSSSSEESNPSLHSHSKNPSFIREHLTITPRHGFSVARGGIDALLEEEERSKSQTTTDDEDGGDDIANIVNPNVLASHLQRASLQMKRIKKRKSAPVLNEICEESELEGDLHDHSLFRYRNNNSGRHSISTSSPSTLRRPPGGSSSDNYLQENRKSPALFGSRTGRPLRRRKSNRSSSSENSDDEESTSRRESSSNLSSMTAAIFRRRDSASDDDDRGGSAGHDRSSGFRYDKTVSDVIVEQDNEAKCGGDGPQNDPGKGAEDAAEQCLLNNATHLRTYKKQINLDGTDQKIINVFGIRSRSAESRSSSSYSAVTSSRSCSSARSSCSNLSGHRLRLGANWAGKWLKNSSSTRSDTGLVLRCHANNARVKCRCVHPTKFFRRSSSSTSFASLMHGENNLRVCTSLDCVGTNGLRAIDDEPRHHRSCSLPRRHRKAKKSKDLLGFHNQAGTPVPLANQFEGSEVHNVPSGSHESVAVVKRSNLSIASSTCSGSKFVVDPLNELPPPLCLTPLPESSTKEAYLDQYILAPSSKPFPSPFENIDVVRLKPKNSSKNSGILTKLNNLKSVSQGNRHALPNGYYKSTMIRKVKTHSCCAVM